MKKTGLLLLLILLSFSLNGKDKWSTMGFEYSHYFDSSNSDSNKHSSHTQSRGITLSTYRFKEEKNLGFYTHTSLLTPLKNEDQSFGSADTRIIGSFFIGPGYKGPVFQNIFQPYGGGGLHYLQFFYHDTFSEGDSDLDYFQLTQQIGLGGEIGCRVNFTENFFLSAGTIIAWDFFSFSAISMNNSSSSKTADKYNALMVNPFITLGYSTNLK